MNIIQKHVVVLCIMSKQNNDVKIAAGINVYNDCNSLKRTLQTTIEYFDRIYVIDGRYPDYSKQTDSNYSTDGTEELTQSYDNVKYIPYFAEQKDKRTRYLKECEYDFLLVIDADEYMIVDSWPTFQDQLQRKILNMPERHRYYQYHIDYQAEPNKKISLARLIYNPNNLVYVNHWVMIADPIIDNKPVVSSTLIEGITLCTDESLRPVSRLQVDTDYQWQLFLKEGVITEKVFHDAECKANFAKHIAYEADIWKNNNVDKIKYISRHKKKS